MITAEQQAARRTRAVQAAVDAARAAGLTVDRGVVLHDVFSVVVHLQPAPVVARIQVVFPPSLSGPAQTARQQREIDVVAWLAEHDVPVVPPSGLLRPEPVRRDGFSMTFWELAEVADDHVAYGGVGFDHTARLNAALAGYPRELPFLGPFNVGLPELLADIAASDLLTEADVSRARAEFAALQDMLGSPAAFHRAFPAAAVQPLHGDGPSHNVIRTTTGIRFADFEDVTCGPAEWDLAMSGPAANAEYDAAATALGLRRTNPEVQRVMDAARTLQFIGCTVLVPQLPILREGLAPAIAAWRASPPLL